MKKLVVLLFAVLLPSCGLFENVTPADVKKGAIKLEQAARALCIVFGEENPKELTGLSVKDFCNARENLDRFMPLVFAAKSGAVLQGCDAD